jgi:hypothetical protein
MLAVVTTLFVIPTSSGQIASQSVLIDIAGADQAGGNIFVLVAYGSFQKKGPVP